MPRTCLTFKLFIFFQDQQISKNYLIPETNLNATTYSIEARTQKLEKLIFTKRDFSNLTDEVRVKAPLLSHKTDVCYHQENGEGMRLVEAWRKSNPLLISRVVDYVVNRQNDDGGYTFCYGAESNAQDTYCGLAILRSLNSSFPNVEKTASFVEEPRLDTIYPIYYVAKAKLLLGKTINENLKSQFSSSLNSKRFFGSTDFHSEASSEFTATYMALELANMLDLKIDQGEVAEWLLSFRNGDGGFGTRDHSNINSTYFAIASLSMLKVNLKESHETLRFVRSCEKPHGGFTVIPINFAPYMEHTYYGAMALDLLGEKSRFPQQTRDWILSCQNGNGGFARSDLGISSFVNTYYAITILRKMAEAILA